MLKNAGVKKKDLKNKEMTAIIIKNLKTISQPTRGQGNNSPGGFGQGGYGQTPQQMNY